MFLREPLWPRALLFFELERLTYSDGFAMFSPKAKIIRRSRQLRRHSRCHRAVSFSYSRPQREPYHAPDHPAPAQNSNDHGDLRVVVEHAEAREDREPVVFDEIRIASGDQR